MKTTLRIATFFTALAALVTLGGATSFAVASPLSVEKIIAADQAEANVMVASNDGEQDRKIETDGQNGDFGNGDGNGEGGEGSEGSESGDAD